MKVILTQTVPGVGEAGTIKEVADGYARNFLIPQRLAVAATRGSLKQAEAQAELYARRAQKTMSALEGTAATIQDKSVTIRARVGSENRLYGSVTTADVADALQQQHGLTIDRRKVHLDEAIHRTGTYSATVDLGNGVTAKFNLEVAPETSGAPGRTASTPDETEPASPAEEAPQAENEEGPGGLGAIADPNSIVGGEAEDVTPPQGEAEAQTEANPS
jgi:large subunit ribosomal protein L9